MRRGARRRRGLGAGARDAVLDARGHSLDLAQLAAACAKSASCTGSAPCALNTTSATARMTSASSTQRASLRSCCSGAHGGQVHVRAVFRAASPPCIGCARQQLARRRRCGTACRVRAGRARLWHKRWSTASRVGGSRWAWSLGHSPRCFPEHLGASACACPGARPAAHRARRGKHASRITRSRRCRMTSRCSGWCICRNASTSRSSISRNVSPGEDCAPCFLPRSGATSRNLPAAMLGTAASAILSRVRA